MKVIKSKACDICQSRASLHLHHVLGRIGDEKNEPYNIITLCFKCHDRWHTQSPVDLQDDIYKFMKEKYGDKFPMMYHGRPYYTKWLIEAEKRYQAKKEIKENELS